MPGLITYIQPTVAMTDPDITITTKAVSGVLLTVPDIAASGTLGTGSVVLSGDTNSAAGNYSVAIGGSLNNVNSSYSSSCGGYICNIDARYSVICGGNTNTISDSWTGRSGIVSGESNTIGVDVTHSFVGAGKSNTVSASYAVIPGGTGNKVTGEGGMAIGNSAHSTKPCQLAISGGKFSAVGDAQRSVLVMRAETTTNVAVRMTSDGQPASALNQLVFPANSAGIVSYHIVAKATGSQNAAFFWGRRRVTKGATNASILVALMGADNSSDTVNQSCSVSVSADTVLGAVKFDVTGAAGTMLHWVASVDVLEVTY